MKKKGLSFEEKRQKMLSIFKEKQEFFHLKDIEKLGVKKGITFQTIKEVLDSLLGDDLVDSDKIGSSVFFWALSSKVYNTKLNKLNKLKEENSALDAKIENIEKSIIDHKSSITETDERKEKIELLEKLKKENDELSSEIETYKNNDPKKFYAMEKDNKIYTELFELECDNIYALEKFVKARGSGESLKDIFIDYNFCGLFDE